MRKFLSHVECKSGGKRHANVIICTDIYHAILDRPDGCRNVWMVPGRNRSQRLRHQQDGSSVMFCGGIIDGKVVSSEIWMVSRGQLMF